MDKKEKINSTSSELVTLGDLTYPLSSMSSWPNTNYGACGSYYFNGKCHNGADIIATYGTPVYAITSGTVIIKSATQDTGSNCKASGWGYDYGQSNTCNMALLIRHYDASGNPFVAVYGHLRFNSSIQENVTTFTAGQQIGVIGRWYNTWDEAKSDDHLHFGIFPSADPPQRGYGATYCSTSQPASSTFPQGCSNNGFVPPGTFITQHFPASPPFSHSDPPVVCKNQPTHDASWYYTCEQQAAFEEGEQIWVLLRLHDVDVNHQFKVKAYKNDVYQWSWTTDVNDVGSSTWQYSHFWPELQYALTGTWRFDLFLIPQGGSDILVNSAHFRVFNQGELYINEEGGGGTTFSFPGLYYYYDGNGYTCPGPIEGDESTNWVYTCGLPRVSFEQGETVNALVRIDDISVDFRFSVDMYKDNVYEGNSTSGWNDVGEWGWSKAYFPIMLQNPQPGNWEFRVSADEGNGFELLDTLSFVVTPDPTPYAYGGLVSCLGPITGGEQTNWDYTCENPTESFSSGQTAIALARIDNVLADHRWMEVVYVNGTYQWDYTTGWNDVGQWGWSKSFFPVTTSSVWPGNWEYRIYLDVGNGFEYLDSAFFTVQ